MQQKAAAGGVWSTTQTKSQEGSVSQLRTLVALVVANDLQMGRERRRLGICWQDMQLKCARRHIDESFSQFYSFLSFHIRAILSFYSNCICIGVSCSTDYCSLCMSNSMSKSMSVSMSMSMLVCVSVSA